MDGVTVRETVLSPAMAASHIDNVIAAVEKGAAPKKIQDRTRMAMRVVMATVGKGLSIGDAARAAGVGERSIKLWRSSYPAFGEEMIRLVGENQRDRVAERAEAKQARREEEGLVLRHDEPVPDRGGLAEFRMRYFGRPTPLHQEVAVMALEDPSNLYTFIFGPTGMGKDTIAGDYLAWESCPDRTGLRAAWFMETAPFSKRRLGRLSKYLTDPTAYRHAPEKTPGGKIPTGSLIEDYGPFEWKPGMVWEDGTEVERPEWTGFAKYYVRSVAPEQDPNLWATGVEGATYGSRIGLAVLSDIFTVENQKSPTDRVNQYVWVEGTLDTRLDEDGRLVGIGTMLPIENNWERLLEEYVGEARVLREVTIGPGTYRKYANGVAVVIIKAIYKVTDEVTGDEREESYWPERFPLYDQLLERTTGQRVNIETLTDAEALELMDAGWKRIRGLRSRRERSPVMFKAMFQQERDSDVGIIDFTDEVFEAAYDHERSFGYVRPTEIRLQGVDPAQRYGAGWVMLGVDRELGEMCVIDFWWGEKLGFTGIKEKLVLQPMGRYLPSWLCYEGNRDGAVLGDEIIQRAIRAAGVSIFTPTVGRERGDPMIGPGALATWMRNAKLRIPYATADDRAKAEQLKSHLRAFDKNPTRSKPGHAGHAPDDLTFALYAPWRKGVQILGDGVDDGGIIFGVPGAIRRAMDRRREEYRSARGIQVDDGYDEISRGNPIEMLMALGGMDTED